jgi:transcriptional regulator with GAF, ATPase, and Fis domain
MKLTEHKWEQLVDLAGVLHHQNDFREILRLVAQQAVSLLHAETALILMVNPRTQDTIKTVMREGQVVDDRRFKLLQNQISGWLMLHRQPLLSQDIKNDHRLSSVNWDDVPVKTVIGVPLQIENTSIGTLILLNKTAGEEFEEGDLVYLEKLAVIVAPYLRNVQKISEYFNAPLPEAALVARYEQAGLIGKSPRFIELLRAIEAAARCDVRVLLEGQTGTGKELAARAIHRFSSRHAQPFIAIDCGAIPASLIESELFGHLKGAFTGATHDRKGLLAEANQGTLFMDEIANLPMEVQAKFMRFLQEGEIRPVGSNKTQKVDVRIISAGSQPLQKLIEAKQFREDLFYRLHVYPIHVPSLNERSADIPLLAGSFLKKFSKQQQKHGEHFSRNILQFMQQRQWTGNIRELENFVERLVTLAPPEAVVVDEDVLPPDLKKQFKRIKSAAEDAHVSNSLVDSLALYEQKLIRSVLQENDWNQSKAARALKVSVQNLRYRMKKLGIAMSVKDESIGSDVKVA